MKKVLEDSVLEYERSQWEGLDVQLAMSTASDVAVPEPEDGVVLEPPPTIWDLVLVGHSWTWTSTLLCMREYMSALLMP